VATDETIPEALEARFSEVCAGGQPMTYADFSEIALYDPEYGYYRADRRRVGKSPEADFYTATSVGEVFGRLLAAAAKTLLRPGDPGDFALAEIGPEPGAGIFHGLETGFAETLAFPLGKPLQLNRPTILVANEVLDAQPFHRLVFRGGRWRELGVLYSGGRLDEIELPELSPPAARRIAPDLPAQASENHHCDLSLAAEDLAGSWARIPGVDGLILIDYGKSWREMLEGTPQGTARAYRSHQQESNLLASPGQQDLTTHVCWDRIQTALTKAGLKNPSLVRQEAFFVNHAWDEAERVAREAAESNQNLLGQLKSLLHPAGFGARFQVLFARRHR